MSHLKNKSRSLRLGALLGMMALSGPTGCGEGMPEPMAATDEAAKERLASPRPAVLDAQRSEGLKEPIALYTAATTGSGTSQDSGTASITDSDTTPPTTRVTAPGLLATVSGTITVSATASDNVGVTRVDFLVDNVVKGSDSSGPYTLALDSTTLSNASHSLVAKAYDAAGNVGSSAAVSFTVNNAAPVPVIDNSLVIAQMKARLDSMDATLAKMGSTNKNVKTLKADVATQRTLVNQIK